MCNCVLPSELPFNKFLSKLLHLSSQNHESWSGLVERFEEKKFWCKHIILKISKLLRPFTSVEDVSTKYSFQTYEHFNIAFLCGQIWRPDQIFHPIDFHLDLKHTHLDPVCNIRSEYTFNERIYLHIPARLFNILNESEYKFIQMIRLYISLSQLILINTKPATVSTATTSRSVLFFQESVLFSTKNAVF